MIEYHDRAHGALGSARQPARRAGPAAAPAAEPAARETAALREAPSLSMVGLLVITFVIGYEWLVSGLVKFVRGDFPAGLADELLKKSAGTAAWYGRFLTDAVMPNAVLFGYAIETAEVLAGVALVAGPLVWLCVWARVSDGVRYAVLWSIAVSAMGATFLAVNLHLANGASHPWLMPGDAFDEGIDIDSVLPAIQLVIATVSLVLLARLRRDRRPHSPDPTMHRTDDPGRAAPLPIVTRVLALGTIALLCAARPASAQDGKMPPAGEREAEEVPHPFFTHMGLPEGVGVYSLRVLGITSRAEGRTAGDFAFHFETGITERIGLHIRNDRFRNNDKTEAMLQFAAFVSKDGMTGFAPLIEFEFPTKKGASRINSLVGFTTSTGTASWAFNQVVHYDPREDMVDGSVALVVKAGRFVSPVVELLGEGGKGQTSAVNVLAGIKVRLREGILLGFAYQLPITDRREFTRQAVFGPDFGWTR